MLRRTDCPSHEEMSVKYKEWLSQGAVISLRKPKGGDGWQWRFGKNEICGGWTFRGLPGPGLGFLGGSAEGVQRIGSGSSTRLKKLVILAAIALEHSSIDIFSDKYFLILRHLAKIIIIFVTQI